jgi:uncharacterized protein
LVRIAVFINTPAQVHFFKNIVRILRENGNDVYLLARDYGETISLLNEMNLSYYVYCNPPTSKFGKIFNLPFDVIRAYKYLKDLDIDIVTGFGIYDAYTSFLLRVPAIIFTDSEPSANSKSYAIQYKLYIPFVAVAITPDTFRDDLGPKQIRIHSYKEMAYLHPKYYSPKEDILDLLGLEYGEDYAILRFNAFDAVHDVSRKGFSEEDKINLVKSLETYLRVVISSEGNIPKELKKYASDIPKNRIHDALYFSKLLVTDTQTMATEGAILGTPTIRCNTFVGNNDMGNFLDLENNFHLMINCIDPKVATQKAVEWAKDKDEFKDNWLAKREKLLREKIDITKFMVSFIENYLPSSNQRISNYPTKGNLTQLDSQSLESQIA